MDMKTFIEGVKKKNKSDKELVDIRNDRQVAIDKSVSEFKSFFAAYGFVVSDNKEKKHTQYVAQLDNIEDSKITLSFPDLVPSPQESVLVRFTLEVLYPKGKSHAIAVLPSKREGVIFDFEYSEYVPWHNDGFTYDSLREILEKIFPSETEMENRALREAKIAEANDSSEEIGAGTG